MDIWSTGDGMGALFDGLLLTFGSVARCVVGS